MTAARESNATPTSDDSATPPDERDAAVVLRIPAELIRRVDQAVRARRVRIPRHTWLLEAVVEKLDREET